MRERKGEQRLKGSETLWKAESFLHCSYTAGTLWRPSWVECVYNRAAPNSFYMLGRGKAEVRAKFHRVSPGSRVTLDSES